jgi:ABC-2 type transport system ATP-binding protein
LAGDLDELLEEHRWVVGSAEAVARLPRGVEVVGETHHDRHSRLLVRSTAPWLNPALTVSPVDLEDLVLAHLEPADGSSHHLRFRVGSRTVGARPLPTGVCSHP